MEERDLSMVGLYAVLIFMFVLSAIAYFSIKYTKRDKKD